MRLGGLVLLLWWTGVSEGCECCPSRDFYLVQSSFTDFRLQTFLLIWGGVSEDAYVDVLEVELPPNTELRPGVEMLELYVDGTSRVALAGQLVRDVDLHRNNESSCTHDYLEYPLSELPDGVYTVVHRRSSAPEGLLPYEVVFYGTSWDTFDGEDALITTFPYPPGFDGGLPDGGSLDGGP